MIDRIVYKTNPFTALLSQTYQIRSPDMDGVVCKIIYTRYRYVIGQYSGSIRRQNILMRSDSAHGCWQICHSTYNIPSPGTLVN